MPKGVKQAPGERSFTEFRTSAACERLKALIQAQTWRITVQKFRTKSGRLTPYAFACGYIEQRDLPGANDRRVTLWREGGPLYQVRANDFTKGERMFWDSFETLTAARKRYDRAVREAKADAQANS